MTTAAPAERSELTPAGPIPSRVIEAIGAFGEQANRDEYPLIDVGGYIVLGRAAAIHEPPRREIDDDVRLEHAAEGRAAWQEARSEPWSRERSARAASSAEAHAVERELALAGVDLSELRTFYGHTTIVSSSDRLAYVTTRAGLFRGLPFGVEFFFEMPTVPRDQLIVREMPSPVPDIRAWAKWVGGQVHGSRLRSHHMYPDHAICACMLHEFIRGVHPVRDYVAFCVMWSAKVLHEMVLGTYPGRQHYPAHARRRRDRLFELCGCTSEKLYKDCCRKPDRLLTAAQLWADVAVPRRIYLSELRAQGRPVSVPEQAMRGSARHRAA